MFSLTYKTRYGDYKDFDTIKVSSVIDIVQDAATRHSAECGFGMLKLRDMGYAWLLQGTKIHFEKSISTQYDVEVETSPRGWRGTTSERGTYLKQNGKLCAKAVSNWFLFDTKEQKPCRIPKEMSETYGAEDFGGDEFFRYRKPTVYEIDEVSYTVTVTNRDIDTNMHLNNEKAVEKLLDALPFDFSFTDMNVFYKRATYLGDTLEVCVKEIEGGYYVHLQTPDTKELCVAGEFVSKE